MTGKSIAARGHAQEIAQQFDAQADTFRTLLPAHIDVARFKRVTMTALNNNPDLLTADRRSLFIACQRAAEDGLYPDGREAALVMFKNFAQYMPMVAGLRKLARQSGEVKTLTAGCIYEGEAYEYWVDDQGRHFRHQPSLDADQSDDKLRAAYAIATLANGETALTVMGRAQIEKRRRVSRSADRGPWATWYPEMAMKTAIKALSKELPRSSERDDTALFRALDRGDETAAIQVVDTSGTVPAAIEDMSGDSDEPGDEGREIIAQAKAQLGEAEDDPFAEDDPLPTTLGSGTPPAYGQTAATGNGGRNVTREPAGASGHSSSMDTSDSRPSGSSPLSKPEQTRSEPQPPKAALSSPPKDGAVPSTLPSGVDLNATMEVGRKQAARGYAALEAWGKSLSKEAQDAIRTHWADLATKAHAVDGEGH